VDERLSGLLDLLRRQGLEHDRAKSDRLQRLRNLEPDTAAVLAILVRATAACDLLELGASNGYSTLWLADAARSVEGRLVSVEVDPARTALAAENLRAGGLSELVELRVQDAAETLRSSRAGAWDMIFLDAERPAYASYWPELVRVLRPGGLLAVDNVISHADELRDFRALAAADERVSEALVPTGAGLLLIVLDPRLRVARGREAEHLSPQSG
jgi:predicted O-methyltransferase YrrM